MANPARGLLNREKKKKEKSGSAPPPPPRAARSEKIKINFTRRIHMSRRYAGRRYAGLGPSRVRTRIPTTRRLGQWVSQNSTLPCAIATFPVSLPLSSPGDVWPRLYILPSTRLWTSAHPPWAPQPTPQHLTSSLSCQTPGCRSVHNRSTLSPSHPVLSALRPQHFSTWFAFAAARSSFGWASQPTKKVFSCATLSQCSRIGFVSLQLSTC